MIAGRVVRRLFPFLDGASHRLVSGTEKMLTANDLHYGLARNTDIWWPKQFAPTAVYTDIYTQRPVSFS